MKNLIISAWILIFVTIAVELKSQEIHKLWEGQSKPYYKENNLKEYEKEVWGTTCISDVTEPTLTFYKAEGKNTGVCVIIIPGGGYTVEAIYHEGYDLAKVLAKNGINAAVLKYRLPNPLSSDQPQLVPLADSRQALKLARKLTDKYLLHKNKIGVLGFSAGSHLATITSLWKSDDTEGNPDFSGLIYGVTNNTEANIKWLEECLYFRKLTADELSQNNLLQQVNSKTPPAFIVHACDDDVCYVDESILYAQKLIENHVSVEMHLFPKGGHGFGMGRKADGTNQWVELFINWAKLL